LAAHKVNQRLPEICAVADQARQPQTIQAGRGLTRLQQGQGRQRVLRLGVEVAPIVSQVLFEVGQHLRAHA
jgi:hypothetical protein